MKPKNNAGQRPKGKGSSFGRIILGFFIVLAVMVLGVGIGFLTATMNTKDNIAEDIRPPASSQIYDINGNELANIHAEENRVPVKIDQVPKDLQHAFVAVEDARFYDHSGIDPRGIIRALIANISGRTISEGGSTITQQLAKNAYLTQDRTLKRKIQEVFLALQIESKYTKQEILEMYMNQIYFGEGAYGVQAAAKTYFGKDVSELTLNECAMLAGIPKSPNYFSPRSNYDASVERKNVVLGQMVKYGYINNSAALKLRNEKINIIKPKKKSKSTFASYFIEYVTQQVSEKYGADAIYKNGLKIYTSLDPEMQKQAEAAASTLQARTTDSNGVQQPQVALVAIDPHNGQIKAMVGGRGTDQFNRATMAVRQPGSAFKPFVFAAALEDKFTPATIIEDKPIKIGGWEPQNFDMTFHGSVTLAKVAKDSLNVPTVKIADKIGIDKPIYYAQQMGITTFVLDGAQNDRNLSTALGGLTKGVTPLELTSAYGTFANEGVHVEPVAIVKILDRTGKVLEEADPKKVNAISKESAAELTSMLKGVVNGGTGGRAYFGRPAAGKTGTTSDYHDAWFVGYTPDLVAGVWIGNDSNTSLGGMTGGAKPAEVWKAFMSQALKNVPAKDFDGTFATKANAVSHLEESGDANTKGLKDTKKNAGKGSKNGQAGTNNGKGGGAPQGQQPSQPAAPPSAAPSPTGGGEKGRN